jgi:hypothetical protein
MDEKRITKIHELIGTVRAFADSQSMKALAETEPDFDWWFTLINKKIAEVDATQL